MRMTAGQKTPLSSIGAVNRVTIDVDYGLEDVDVVLFGLDAARRISNEDYTVLFSNPSSPDGSLAMRTSSGTTSFDIDLERLPASIDRLLVAASHDERPLSAAKPFSVTLAEASFDVGASLGDEKAAMLVEVYRHQGSWRLAAVGQGFAQGLARLIEHLGGSVAGETETHGPDVSMSNPTSPSPADKTKREPASKPLALSKITLEKRRSVSLEKTSDTFGDIILNLRWTSRRGFFGGSALDLDLGCLFEMVDGQKGVIQALGKSFGSSEQAPFIELDGDDRSGASSEGETIRINGRHFDKIRRIAVFALIYEGAMRWDQTGARASIRMPDQPEVVVEINEGDDRQRIYGMALIENDHGAMRITNHAVAYHDQKEYADAIGIHLRWSVGRKD